MNAAPLANVCSAHDVRSLRTALAGVAAALACLGGVALAGWALDAPRLARWGLGGAAMGPAEAVAVLAFSVALALCVAARAPHVSRALAALGALGSLALVAGDPVGAACLAASHGALLIMLTAEGRGPLRVAWGLLALTSMAAFLSLLGSALGAPTLLGFAPPPAPPGTGAAALLMGLALGLLAARRATRTAAFPAHEGGRVAVYAAVFVALAAVTLAGGYGYYLQAERLLHAQLVDHMRGVAWLKSLQLTTWRDERLGEADVLARDAALAAVVGEALRARTAAGDFAAWYAVFRRHGQSDAAWIFDAARGPALAWPRPGDRPPAEVADAAREALRTSRGRLVDVHLDPNDHLAHMALVVPIMAGAAPVAALALRIDLERFLYPCMRGWPVASDTAETLLVRRDGDDALVLTPLRFAARAPLRLRLPLRDTRRLAVRAVLGQTGAHEGLDYRGRPAFGVLSAVPASPWHLVARIDASAVQSSMRRQFGLVSALAAAALVAIASLLGLVARSRRLRVYQKQAELAVALTESDRRLRLALAVASQGLFELDFETGEGSPSPEYAAMLGYQPDEFRPSIQEWADRVHPDDQDRARAEYERCLAGPDNGFRVEVRMRTKEGAWRWVHAVGTAMARGPDGRARRLLGIGADVTARKLAELRSQRAAHLYAALSACNEAIVRCRTEEALFPKVCEAAVEHGSMALAWVGLVDEATGVVRPVAWHGDAPGYVEGIDVTVHADRASGQGPGGRAAREGAPVWVTDFANDPGTRHWHARAAAYGWVGAAGLPLTRDGRTVGALVLYTRAPDAFDEEGRRLLMEMAADVSFAMEGFARDARQALADAALRDSLREKQALLKEVHHRVKNNLQVITSLLRLEMGRFEGGAVHTVLREMKNRVLSMALMHETLYHSDNLALIDLATYLKQLGAQLVRSMAPPSGAVTLRLELEPAHVDMDQAVPCGLLVNELVSNCLKHGFPDGRHGEVRIALRPVDGGPSLCLEVSDTGVGLPPDYESRRADTLGLQLVSDLVRQLRGRMEVGRGPGASFRVVFTPRAPVRTVDRSLP